MKTIFIFNLYPHREIKLYIPFFVGVKMIIYIACVFSGHILVKTIIPSELYCCNMIIFCKLVKLMIVQTSLCKGSFLAGEAVLFVAKGGITLLEL